MGATLRLSGATTGSSTGEVIDTNYSRCLADHEVPSDGISERVCFAYLFRATTPENGGDSGGVYHTVSNGNAGIRGVHHGWEGIDHNAIGVRWSRVASVLDVDVYK